MQPLAYLILSNLPGENRLKNIKYFLGLGDNVLGTDSRCQIVIPPQYEMLNYATNIRLGHNFLTIEALHPHLVYLQANLLRTQSRQNNADNYFPLAQNVQYLPRIGEFFFVGRIKAIVGIASKHDFSLMKNIINRECFKFQAAACPPLATSSISAQPTPSNKPHRIQLQSQQGQSKMQAQLSENITLQEPFESHPHSAILQNHINKSQQFMQTQQQNLKALNKKQRNQQALQQQRSDTERLDEEEYQLEPTLVLEDGIYANQPTLNLDQLHIYQQNYTQQQIHNQKYQYFRPVQVSLDYSQKIEEMEAEQKKLKPFQQQALMNEIRMQEKSQRQQKSQHQQHHDDQMDFSMPDTIVDKEPDQHLLDPPKKLQNHSIFRQVESNEEHPQDHSEQQPQDQDQMPPTIQDEPCPQKLKPAKTLIQQHQQEDYPVRLYMSDQISNKKEFEQSPQALNDIQNFDELFGIEEKPSLPQHFASLPAITDKELPQDLSLMHVSSMGTQKLPSNTIPKQENTKRRKPDLTYSDSRIQKTKQKKNLTESVQIELSKRVNIAGFKPTTAHKDFLKKQGLEIVHNPHQEYGILLVKQPLRLCNKLLLALIDGRQIQNEQWIFNKQSEIQSKLNGLPWKQIYEKRGTHGQALKGKGKFYISKRLEDLLQGVIEKLGGEIITQLNDKKKVINVVLRPEDSMDTELYLTSQMNKKWRFFKSEVIVDCVLTGKYSIDEKYVINMFKDDA